MAYFNDVWNTNEAIKVINRDDWKPTFIKSHCGKVLI